MLRKANEDAMSKKVCEMNIETTKILTIWEISGSQNRSLRGNRNQKRTDSEKETAILP